MARCSTCFLACCLCLAMWTGCYRPLQRGAAPVDYPLRPANDDRLESLRADLGGAQAPILAPAAALATGTLGAEAVRRLAVENSPAVRAAEARVAEARSTLRAAGLWPNPELEGRLLFDLDGDPSGEAALTFPIPLGGRLSAEVEEARVALERSRLERALARRQAVGDADLLLARLAHDRARLALFEDLARRSRENGALARSRLSASMADSVDVALVLAEASHDRRAVARARAEVAAVEAELRGLLGLRPGEGRFQVDALRAFALPAVDLESGLDGHPAVLRARLALKRREREAARTAAERVPDLMLGPAMEAGGEGLSLGLSAGIALPLLDTGRAAYERAVARRATAEEMLRGARQQARLGLELVRDRLQARLAELTELTGEPERLVQEAVSLAEVRFRSGKLDVLKLLSIHRAQVTLLGELQDLLLAAHRARLDLERLLGHRVAIEEVAP